MKLLFAIIVIFLAVNCSAQSVSKEDEFKIQNQIKVIKSYIEPWSTTGITLVKIDSAQTITRHSCRTTKRGEEPLWLVDGKIKEAFYINNINPNDIQYIEVLKEKLATEKYGEKGRYGAILITMKCKEQSVPVL